MKLGARFAGVGIPCTVFGVMLMTQYDQTLPWLGGVALLVIGLNLFYIGVTR